MELGDALTITGLGMAVVFSGLLLTAALIVVFGRLQSWLDASRDGHPKATGSTEEPSPTPDGPPGPEVEPEILTVIATVLEIERRLHRIGADRPATDQGASR
jgi:Na+-transporting methylmalonyl-CoA/oxaloacetate decarboxylase gamma subunit